MATETFTGILTVIQSGQRKQYKAKFESKGKSKEMPIFPDAIYFVESEAADGDPITIERNAGKISKVTITGKTVSPSKAATSAAQHVRQKQNTGAGSSAYQKNSKIPPATAPYNFVEQNCILEAPEPKDGEEYFSGTIVCSLTALTPLLVAGQQEKKSEDEASLKTFFTVNGRPVITGSSLKGLIRSCIETLSYSGISLMNDRNVFWRSFDDDNYRSIMNVGGEKDPQKAGYLVRHGADFEIVPVNYSRILETDRTNKHGKYRVKTGPLPRQKHD